MIFRMIPTLTFSLFAAVAAAADIDGFWKNSEEPGWIEIKLDEGVGTVVRNDNYPERVGRQILRDLRADESEENLWHGQVYAERLGEYRDADISLAEPDRMEFKVKVGFFFFFVEWVRVDEVPMK